MVNSTPQSSVFVSDSSTPDELADPLALRSVELGFREKKICFVVPAGAKLDAYTINLPGGMLVLGALRAKVICTTGSIIIAKGGEFQGSAEADDIFIEGKVTSASGANATDLTRLKARGGLIDQGGSIARVTGGLIAISAFASVRAHLQARMFHIPRNADMTKSIMETI